MDFLARVEMDRKTANAFNQIRSDILHGSRVLLDDIDGPFSTGLNPGSFEFHINYDTCEQVGRFAMLTCLRQHTGTSP
jgi:hypothetical protein